MIDASGHQAIKQWKVDPRNRLLLEGDDGLRLLSAGSSVVPIILTSPVLNCLGFLDAPTAACVGMAERWAS